MVKRFGQDYEWEPARMIQKDEGPYVLYNDYAALAAAARRLVEAVGWRYECVSCQFDMIGKLGKSVARRELTRTVSLASKDVFGALAEVEALLKEEIK